MTGKPLTPSHGNPVENHWSMPFIPNRNAPGVLLIVTINQSLFQIK